MKNKQKARNERQPKKKRRSDKPGMSQQTYLGDGVGVGVLLLPQHAHQVAHDVFLISRASLDKVKAPRSWHQQHQQQEQEHEQEQV